MENHLRAATAIANVLDNQFSFLGRRFGLTAVMDLFPGGGDVVAFMLSLYLIWIGVQMGVPTIKIVEMLGNITFNFIIGLIPILGDAAYIFHKANLKNLAILKQHAQRNIIHGEVVK